MHGKANLHQEEDAHGSHMLAGLHVLKANKANLHSEQHSDNISAIVGDIQPHGIATGDQKHQNVKRYQVDNKDITSPSRDHVEIAERRGQGPSERAGVDGLHKQVKGQEQGENGDTLIVIGAGDRSGDVTGANGDQSGGNKAGAGVPNLFAEEISDEGGVGGEKRRR